jgi:hypothetical protein
VSHHGNTTDGNTAGGVHKYLQQPQNNKPMSVNKGLMKRRRIQQRPLVAKAAQ